MAKMNFKLIMEFPHSQQVVADLEEDADSALELTVEMGFLHTKKEKIFQLSELHSSENPLFHMHCIPSPRIISDCLIFYFLDASRSTKNSPSSLLSLKQDNICGTMLEM